MWTERYYDVDLNGYLFVQQAIEFGMQRAQAYTLEIPLEVSVTIGTAFLGVVACVIAWRVLKEPE
jgi:hypothetical protein